MELPEVRRFLQQELLKKVGHSWWNRPRVYRHDLADERDAIAPVCSGGTLGPGAARSVAGPTGVQPRRVQRSDDTGGAGSVPGHVIAPHPIVLAGGTEESPRTREGRVVAARLKQEMGRRSVAEAIRPIKERAVASSSSAEKSITQEMVAEACDTLVRERHPASPPVWPEGSGIPAQNDSGGANLFTRRVLLSGIFYGKDGCGRPEDRGYAN